MTNDVGGFPYWELTFTEHGDGDPGESVGLRQTLLAGNITDLIIMAHGLSNSPEVARSTYQRFFAEVHRATQPLGSRPGRNVGTVGLRWPAMRWLDEDGSVPEHEKWSGSRPEISDADLVRGLRDVYGEPTQLFALDHLEKLLTARPASFDALEQFRRESEALLVTDQMGGAEDAGELAILETDIKHLFEHFASVDTRPDLRSGWSISDDHFATLWKGARETLRAVSYAEMKRRAGVIGLAGLAPFIATLRDALPDLRMHLVGHGVGARLVSYALLGLDDAAGGSRSPVKSLLLIQGAFSHFAFAPSLPHDPSRSGALAMMERRVDGPLLATFSDLDTAVGYAYPMASAVRPSDATLFADSLVIWGGLGYDGFRGVDALWIRLPAVGQPYPASSQFINLDANSVIRAGEPPAGAHADIMHPEVAWALVAAAGLASLD